MDPTPKFRLERDLNPTEAALGIKRIQDLLNGPGHLSTGEEDGLQLAIRLLKEHEAGTKQ